MKRYLLKDYIDILKKEKLNAKSLILKDEKDAVGRLRGFWLGGGHDDR